MKLYSNEIVFRGHPDKVCDQISDAILDECLRQDPNSRCGIEKIDKKQEEDICNYESIGCTKCWTNAVQKIKKEGKENV